MEEQHTLITSALSCTVERGDVAVRIQIHRMANEHDWALEVEDHEGGSTVWEDRFSSDKDALDEAMRTIEVEGITSFVEPPQA